MINEFDHVKIKTNGIIGEVVDVYVSNEEKIKFFHDSLIKSIYTFL